MTMNRSIRQISTFEYFLSLRRRRFSFEEDTLLSFQIGDSQQIQFDIRIIQNTLLIKQLLLQQILEPNTVLIETHTDSIIFYSSY